MPIIKKPLDHIDFLTKPNVGILLVNLGTPEEIAKVTIVGNGCSNFLTFLNAMRAGTEYIRG